MTITESRPRWGTFSVKSHMNLDALTLDVLLYDGLVFPTPWDEKESARWDKEGWDTATLATRIVQLGDLAFTAPWSPVMHSVWYEEFQRQKAGNPDDPNLAFNVTAQITAAQYFADLVEQDDDRVAQLKEPPQLVAAFAERNLRKHAKGAWAQVIAAYQNVGQAERMHRVTPLKDPKFAGAPTDTGLALRFDVVAPVVNKDEGVFLAAVKLANDADFQLARRKLWAWEKDREDYNAQELAFAIKQLVDDYNKKVTDEFKKTRTNTVLYVVPIALGVVLDLTVTGGLGTAAGVALDVSVDTVKAKFPQLGESAAKLSHHPGSAVARAISVLGHK